mgnify:CR=1 FL=1
MLYKDSVDYDSLRNIILFEKWRVNIAGFITKDELVNQVIKKKHILPKNAILNRYTRMDAENYYVQAGDLHSIEEIFSHLGDLF